MAGSSAKLFFSVCHGNTTQFASCHVWNTPGLQEYKLFAHYTPVGFKNGNICTNVFAVLIKRGFKYARSVESGDETKHELELNSLF